MAASLDPSAILGQLTESFVKLPIAQKIVFPLLIVGSVLGIIFVSKWANRADYAVLFSDLKPTDASAVIEKLKSQKIKYEVRGDGTTIAVAPPEIVHELRISLAADGVPKGGTIGFELFDSSSLGSTTFQEKIKFQRAIQGELERTIGSLEAVATARVHLAQPEKTVFAKKGSETTASVMLQLRSGGELGKKQIKGIQNLVAGSVEGLTPDRVTIVDTAGNLLSEKDEGEDKLGIEETRIAFQREIEKGYVQRIEQMLTRVLGANKVIARVTTEMDFSSSEREEESYDPGGQVIRSQRSVEEGAGGSARGGVPGVVSNLSNDTNLLAPPGTGDTNANRREEVKNFEVSRAVSKTSSPRGKMVRLSVAVLVDGNYEAPPGAAADTPKVYKPLDPEMLNRIESVVRSSVGFDGSRGDTITVENIPFNAPDTDYGALMQGKMIEDIVYYTMRYLLPIMFVVLFFVMVVRPLIKFLVTPTEAEVDLSRLLPTGIQELEKELETERSRAEIPTIEPTVNLEALEELVAENSKMVKDNPHQTALLIRYWLNDGRI